MITKVDNELQILKQLFTNLDNNQKRAFLKFLKTKPKAKIINIGSFSMSLFRRNKRCFYPLAGKKRKNGKVKGIQRLLCKKCNKTFSYTNKTIFAHSKYPLSTWKLYIQCMLNKFSLKILVSFILSSLFKSISLLLTIN